MDVPDIWYKPGEEQEHADARYLYSCIRDKRATHIMDIVRLTRLEHYVNRTCPQCGAEVEQLSLVRAKNS